MEHVEKQQQHHEIADAGFGAGAPASQPYGAGQRGIREMSREYSAAVRNGIQERLAEIETCVHAHRKPEAAGSAQGETPEQAGEHYPGDSGPTFPWVAEVHGTKGERREQ